MLKHTSGLKVCFIICCLGVTWPSSDVTYTFKEAFTYVNMVTFGAEKTDGSGGAIKMYTANASSASGRQFAGQTTVGHSYFSSITKLSTTKILVFKDTGQGGIVWGY